MDYNMVIKSSKYAFTWRPITLATTPILSEEWCASKSSETKAFQQSRQTCSKTRIIKRNPSFLPCSLEEENTNSHQKPTLKTYVSST